MSAETRFTWGDAVVSVRSDLDGSFRVVDAGGETHRVTAVRTGDGILVTGDGDPVPARAVRDGQSVWVRYRGRTYRMEIDGGPRRRRNAAGSGGLGAPMPGQVLQYLVAPGTRVEPGTPLLVLEAMKMQIEIKAPVPGRVVRFLAEVGEQVPSGTTLVELDTE